MSIFPFIHTDPVDEVEPLSELPLYKEYAYDYEHNRLKLDAHNQTYLVTGNDALKIWIYKALKTERFQCLAYTDQYGNESQSLLGTAIDQDIAYVEIKRFIIEALMFNDYIKEIRGFVFERLHSGVKATFEVITIYGTMSINFDIGGASYV